MKIRAIITGATGMIGKGVLLECLDHHDVEQVLAITRRPLDIQHPKLINVIHSDFMDLSAIRDQLTGYNACFFCLGVSATGMSESEYDQVTRQLTLNFAETALMQNPDITFCYISGAGTDSTEGGRMMWARVKGKTENQLLAMPFKKAYMFRPAFIQPMKGIRSSTKLYNVMYDIMRPFYPIIKKFPKYSTTTVKLGDALINAASMGYEKKILESRDINILAEKDS